MRTPGDVQGALAPTPLKTAAYTAEAWDFVRTDATGGSLTVTLPYAPPPGTVVAVKQVATTGPNTTTVACAGSDVLNYPGNTSTSITLPLAGQGATLLYQGGTWVVQADDLPLAQLDARYLAAGAGVTSVTAGDTSIVIAGTAAAPTVKTGTLDVIATQHPPAASVGMNSQKLTSLLFGASTNDAAAWGQLAGPAASDVGLLAWTGDTLASGGNVSAALTTAGTVYLSSFINRKVQTFTNLLLYVGTAGNTLTSGQCFAGIYDSTGALKATTTDQAANWGGTGLRTAAFTVAFSNAPVGTYFAGVFFNGTTGPVFKGSAAPASLYNAGLSGANLRCATTSSTGNTTAMPTPLTLSANSSSNSEPFWAAIT